MTKWTPTSERLPTREDAGDWRYVNVLQVPRGLDHYDVMLRTPQDVVTDNGRRFTHWAPLPDRPKEE